MHSEPPRTADRESGDHDLPRTLYAELRRIAAVSLRGERSGHTLQPTDLVHELWLRQPGGASPIDRAEFLRHAAATMRRVLVDHARKRGRARRGAGRRPITLSRVDAPEGGAAAAVDLPDLDDALAELEGHRPECARVVELRFFAGLEMAEIAEVMGVSKSTVEREYTLARAWLHARLAE